MTLDLIPGHQELMDILAAQVDGPSRVVHDALKPYVEVQPASPGEAITIHAGPRLRLMPQAPSRTVRGAATVRFVILFDVDGVRLAEVSPPDPRVLTRAPRAIHLGQPSGGVVPEGQALEGRASRARARPTPTPAPLVMAPEPDRSPAELTIPAAWIEVCAREDVHPELGDYLVIPQAMAVSDALPRWVVRSPHVATVSVVKPRSRS